MKTLIIHHLEIGWESGYNSHGTSFDELARKVISHIKRANYDRIILTQFENFNPQDEHYESGLVQFVTDWKDYAYGWTRDSISELEYTSGIFVDGGEHSEVVLIDEWMKELKDDEVRICGAFDGECIEDLEIALVGCGVKFKRIEKLIV